MKIKYNKQLVPKILEKVELTDKSDKELETLLLQSRFRATNIGWKYSKPIVFYEKTPVVYLICIIQLDDCRDFSIEIEGSDGTICSWFYNRDCGRNDMVKIADKAVVDLINKLVSKGIIKYITEADMVSMCDRRYEVVDDKFRKHPDVSITLPTRGSKHAAGWDFYCPERIIIEPKASAMIWTDVKAFVNDDEVLLLFMRSSLSKRNLMLANAVGVIDADYWDNVGNDGNIGVKLYNYGPVPIAIEQGERFAQGVVVNYKEMATGNTANERTGGFGSTGKE